MSTVVRFFPRNVYWNFAREERAARTGACYGICAMPGTATPAADFATILAAAQPDIVHTHLLDGFSASIWRGARRAGVPVVHTAHDYHLLCPRAFLLTRDWQICNHPGVGCRAYRAWHLRTAREVDLFVSPSQFLLDQHRAAGLVARQSAVVRNGIPLPRGIAPKSTAARSARFLLLCRLTVEKGVRVVLEAVASVPRTLDFELVIAGRGAAGRRDPRRPRPRIRASSFLGYVTGEEKEALLTRARLSADPLAVVRKRAGRGDRGGRLRSGRHRQPDRRHAGTGARTGAPVCCSNPATPPASPRDIARVAQRRTAAALTCTPNRRRWSQAHSVERMVDAYLDHYRQLLGTPSPTARPYAAEADYAR